MRTLEQLLRYSRKRLEEKRIERSRQVAEEIIAEALRLPRLALYLNFDRPIDTGEMRLCLRLLERKVRGEPLGYLYRYIDFFHCRLEINSSALIPRQETEILLQNICNILDSYDLEGKEAWDLCCGSGCLGLGLKKRFPHLNLTLSDISKECVELAQKNAQKNRLQVQLLQGDLLAPFAGKKAHFIIANPPYISEEEFASLQPSVRNFEPHAALVSGPTGLEFYQRLEKELPKYLHDGATIFFEIGATQGDALLKLFSKPHYKKTKIEKDWAGHDRFFFAKYEVAC
ncbi:MAG: peptide chain release factor N(5)-glutamine methyltransferase [Candidatus Algichlamydia australiensis]|nr:peptide chain release factor N(5)-glutamine methyltransferase [Chlamydiales bacterium]